MSRKSFDNSVCAGLTLVEVVAAIALLSVLLVMLLEGHAKQIRQVRLSHEKTMAVAAADRILADWFGRDDPLPRNATGILDGNTPLKWSTSSTTIRSATPWECDLIRLTIYETKSNRPILSVDVIDQPESAKESIQQ